MSIKGMVRQTGDVQQLIWSGAEIISVLSDYYELAAGDVTLTGTSADVGPVERGVEMTAMTASTDGVGAYQVLLV